MGVYVHIPFCAQKCNYCDFYSVVVENQTQFEEVTNNYLASVQKEALLYQDKLRDFNLSSLFFGGGTPSLLDPSELGDLIMFLLDNLPFDQNPEVTIEANPASLTKDGLAVLKQAGVNRISLGAQAFQDDLLQTLGREHQGQDILTSAMLVRSEGIKNLSLDLMYGLPGQSLKDWQTTLEAAVNIQPQHLSCYSLILEEGTPFYTWEEQGLIEVPSDDLQSEMYDLARSFLIKHGYLHYEISNFAQVGFESKHNKLYWQNRPFVGLGSGSTGYLAGERYTNVADVGEYIKRIEIGEFPRERSDQVSFEQEMEETMMVGMRLLKGVEEDAFIKRFGLSYFEVFSKEIQWLIKLGLVQFENGFLRVTERGLALENQVSGAFLK